MSIVLLLFFIAIYIPPSIRGMSAGQGDLLLFLCHSGFGLGFAAALFAGKVTEVVNRHLSSPPVI